MRVISARARFALGFVLLLLGPSAVGAQSVAEVVESMFAALERSAQGIDDYTVVQEVMGFTTTTYHVKEVVSGRTVFVPREVSTGATDMSVEDLGFGDISQFGDDLVAHGRYVGREDIDGTAVHVIAVDDLTAFDIGTPSGPEDMDFVPRSAVLYVDAGRSVVRRMTFDGEATTESGTHEVTTQVDLTDYRDVQGLLVPYHTVVAISGVNAMIDPEMKAQFDQMMEQLENMDAQQRAMMERMMGPQIEQMKQMMAGDGDAMTIEVVVTEVRVNAGPPGR